jgi:hypothetical protein
MRQGVSLDRFGHWSSGVAAAGATTPEILSARFTAAARALLASDRVYVGLYHRDISSATIDDCGPDRWNRDDYDAHRQCPIWDSGAAPAIVHFIAERAASITAPEWTSSVAACRRG